MTDELVTSAPDLDCRDVQWVNPNEWHPDRFCDPPDGYKYRDEGYAWSGQALDTIRGDKLDECHHKFISSIQDGIINPIQIRLPYPEEGLPTGTTLLYNGHHRWFMAEKLNIAVPILIGPTSLFWERDENYEASIRSDGDFW